eukprot:416583-Prymnesium_polylepis.1
MLALFRFTRPRGGARTHASMQSTGVAHALHTSAWVVDACPRSRTELPRAWMRMSTQKPWSTSQARDIGRKRHVRGPRPWSVVWYW